MSLLVDPGSRWRNSGSRVLGGTLDGSRPPVPPCDAVAQVVLLTVEQYKLGGGVHGRFSVGFILEYLVRTAVSLAYLRYFSFLSTAYGGFV